MAVTIEPVVTAVSQLPASPADGQIARVRVGSGAQAHDIRLVRDTAAGVWRGEEQTVIRSSDQSTLRPVGAPWSTLQPLDDQSAGLWSFSPVLDAAACWTAGLRLQYRHAAWLMGCATSNTFQIGACFQQFDTADTRPVLATPPDPASIVAQTACLKGGANAFFETLQWVETEEAGGTGWRTLQGPAPSFVAGTPVAPTGVPAITKSCLFPMLVGFNAPGFTPGVAGSGGSVGYWLALRWVA